jgi:hypothetical protein
MVGDRGPAPARVVARVDWPGQVVVLAPGTGGGFRRRGRRAP